MVGSPTRRASSPPTSAYPRATVMLTRSGRSCTGSGRIHCPQPDVAERRLIPWRASALSGGVPPVRQLNVVSFALLLFFVGAPTARPARAERGEGVPASDGVGGFAGAKPPELQTDLNSFMKEVLEKRDE